MIAEHPIPKVIKDILVLENNAQNQIKKCILTELEKIALRTLILDIHRKKDEGKLIGKNSREEYRYYSETWLGDKKNIKNLLEEFPELHRLMMLKLNQIYSLAEEVLYRLEKDKAEIAEIFCRGQSFSKVISLEFKGDSHKGGRQAVRLELDNGTVLYYKPHTLLKNIQYQRVYDYLCRKTGVVCKNLQYLSRSDYGWEENIENKSCSRKEEVRNYYYRMGIHLFLGYALSASDLHGENIIAHGEYPVIVDMETFPGYYIKTEESSADKKIETMLAGSVIHTGMLPVLSWGKDGNAVSVSAMSNGDIITTPFSLPVVKNRETSDICIGYAPAKFQLKECIVRLRGEKVCAGDYVEELVRGFQSAYLTALKDEKVKEMLSGFFDGRARIVLRHTQQYAMYLMLSFHPDFMGNMEQRRKLLSSMHREGETDLQKRIRDSEIKSLMGMDIPYFEMDGNKRCVYDDNEGCIENYFVSAPNSVWEEHMQNLSEEDMRRQCSLIYLSMAMLKETDSKISNITQKLYIKTDRKNTSAKIKEMIFWLLDNAVVASDDINWIGMQFYDKFHWKLRPAGMYLYNGIAGIAVVLAKYLSLFPDETVSRIFSLTVKKMKSYTENLAEADGKQMIKTGLIDGEGSVVFAYILLYRIMQDKEYFCCAEKHYKAMEPFIRKEDCPDYLSGLAGAMEAALLVFRYTKEEEYLVSAAAIEQRLWSRRKKEKKGVGWLLEDMESPLAGMAHGNSGILTAYCDLYEATGNEEYLKKINMIVDYEDSLFREELGNWLDLRVPEKQAYTMNAWCHGAAGILLSRLKLEKITKDERAAADIERCAKVLFGKSVDNRMCLCHGTAGNILIMREYLRNHKRKEDYEIYKRRSGDFTARIVTSYDSLLPAERLNPAFMNGISGIVYALMELYQDQNTPGC